jgi:D-glycero-alpha-D-manno-heptose-7-phosphate kinase
VHGARVIRATAPTRLDFGGGWTDVPPYPQDRGGFVCNVAIERRARVAIQHPTTTHATEPPLARSVLEHMALDALHGSIHNDFPVGAGLGGSSAACVALAAATSAWHGRLPDPAELAETSRQVEVHRLGIAGGRQDHYAAAFGGALGLEFGEQVAVQRIPLTPGTIDALERRCLVYYTGESRISGNTIRAVLDSYAEGVPAVVFALDRMASLARLMAAALTHGDVDALGALVGEHWVHQRSLHPGITTARIEALIAATTAAGALGAKPLGASGGGCVVILSPAGREAEVHAAAAPLAERLPFRIAQGGVRVETDPVA